MFAGVDIVCSMDEIGVVKGGDSDKMTMFGFASSPSKDGEEDRIIQKGLNVEPFLTGGWVNWDHDRLKIIGYPNIAEVRQHPKTNKDGLYVEYDLLKGLSTAERVYKLAKALRDNKAPRSLGLSIEGKKRSVSDKGVILKADVLGLAVTPYPINKETSTSILMKSMTAPDDEEALTADRFLPTEITEFTHHIVTEIKKAMATGTDIGGTSQTGAAAMRNEEIDSKIQRFISYSPERFSLLDVSNLPERFVRAYQELEKLAKCRGGKLTKGEAALMLCLFGHSLETTLKAVELV
jgi:hypothetical protein